MNPRRAPTPRADPDLRDALDDLRAAYRTLRPAADLGARVARAIRAPTRRRRRRTVALALAGTIVATVVAHHVGARLTGPLGGGAAAAPATAATTHGPRPTVGRPGLPASARLGALLASATALPRPDEATRRAWHLATFDPDPRVREAAALLLALAAPDGGP